MGNKTKKREITFLRKRRTKKHDGMFGSIKRRVNADLGKHSTSAESVNRDYEFPEIQLNSISRDNDAELQLNNDACASGQPSKDVLQYIDIRHEEFATVNGATEALVRQGVDGEEAAGPDNSFITSAVSDETEESHSVRTSCLHQVNEQAPGANPTVGEQQLSLSPEYSITIQSHRRRRRRRRSGKYDDATTTHPSGLQTSTNDIPGYLIEANEFRIFGLSIAAQLSKMSPEDALDLQLEIQQLITSTRRSHPQHLSRGAAPPTLTTAAHTAQVTADTGSSQTFVVKSECPDESAYIQIYEYMDNVYNQVYNSL